MEQNKFWNEAWNSEQWTEGTELIDHLIQQRAVDYSYRLLGNINGKKMLEIGCGSGIQALEFSKQGAKLTAIDLSKNSVAATKDRLQNNNFPNVKVEQGNAESLSFKDNTFDLVYINLVLMHADKDKVLSECIRVLKPEGSLIVKENLKHWLFAFPYRWISPYRKTNPQYVAIKDFEKIKPLHQVQHKEFYLFSTFFLFLFYIFKNKMKVLKFFNGLSKIDQKIMQTIPPLKKISWVSVAQIKK